MECSAMGGTTLSLAGPSGHRILMEGRHAVCTVVLHHKHLQSCNLIFHNFSIETDLQYKVLNIKGKIIYFCFHKLILFDKEFVIRH